jgi:alpha-galactosidase/6-phospho-beta-glucosidase family protein
MREHVVIIGAGSACFTRKLVVDLIERGEPTDLALVDTDPVACETAEKLSSQSLQDWRSSKAESESQGAKHSVPSVPTGASDALVSVRSAGPA